MNGTSELTEKVAILIEKVAAFLEADEYTKFALLQHNRESTAKEVVSRVVTALGDQLDPKLASQLEDNATALQLLDHLNHKVSELGGPVSMQRPKSEKLAQPSPREAAKMASEEFANWATGD